MSEFTIDLSGLDDLVRRLDAAPEIVAEEIYESVLASLMTFHQAVVLETPVNLGTLRGSITFDISGSGVSLTGQVVPSVIYGQYVERGRRPGRMPPIDAIEYWVIRKLGIAPPDSRSVAFLIARKIGERGTKGAAMFHKGFLAASDQVERYWQGLPARVAKRI